MCCFARWKNIGGMAVVAVLTAVMSAPAWARQVGVNVAMDKPILLANKKQLAYVRVGLRGLPMPETEMRTPVNVAIVLDKSGSMSGKKIARAREAATLAIDRLSSSDIVSVVTYDSTVNVLVPATKLTDKASVKAAIERIQAGGTTALFAGVSKGAREVRKFLNRNRVNRVILLSDGLANVGPSSPAELGDLGASLIKEGISVTTLGLGLGYNEDLMVELAQKSDGTHAFVENANDLARIFKLEFGDVLSVVAQEVRVRIDCAAGVRPVRVLGRDAEITGRTVTVLLNQLYGQQEKYVLLEVEVPPMPANRTLSLARVAVSYANMATKATDEISSKVSVSFSDSEAVVEKHINRDVMICVVEQIAILQNKLAVVLRDQGRVKEARERLLSNAVYLRKNAMKYKSKSLREFEIINDEDAKNLDERNWDKQRKSMRDEQSSRAGQRGW